MSALVTVVGTKRAPLLLSRWVLPVNLSLPPSRERAVDSSEIDVPLELANAPVDDEPETPEEAAAVAAARIDPRPITTAELRRKLGL